MKRKLLAVLMLAGLGVALFGRSYFSLDTLQTHNHHLLALRQQHPVASAAVFFLTFVLATGLSLPVATIFALLAGSLFGLAAGTLITSFAAALGASLAFLSSRYLLRDWVRRRYGERLRGLQKDGALFLISVRLVPAFPFFLVNLAMGLTPMRLSTFYWSSQLGLLPATLAYVNAGQELSRLRSLKDVFSPRLLLALTLLALLPWLARWLGRQIENRHLRPTQETHGGSPAVHPQPPIDV